MSLATRCTSCGTAFRVVQDQLKVSEGWVRCGRCNAVFNALEGLFDLGRDMPAEWSDTAASNPAQVAPTAAPEPVRTSAAEAPPSKDRGGDSVSTTWPGLDELDPIDAHLFRNRRAGGLIFLRACGSQRTTPRPPYSPETEPVSAFP